MSRPPERVAGAGQKTLGTCRSGRAGTGSIASCGRAAPRNRSSHADVFLAEQRQRHVRGVLPGAAPGRTAPESTGHPCPVRPPPSRKANPGKEAHRRTDHHIAVHDIL